MNSTNETFYPLDFWFGLYGYPYIADIIVAYVITPVWLLSLLVSLFNLLILLKAPFFASHFFSYMRLYVANCVILSLIGISAIFATTHNIFSFSNTYEVVYFSYWITWFASNSFVLFSSCIEISLVVERVLYLLPARYRRIKVVGFYKFFFSLFIACLVINLPVLFLFETSFADIQLDQNSTFRIWYIGVTAFSYELTGEILNYLGYLFRDILPMVSKIVINSLSVYLVRKYVKNKQRIRAATTTANSNLVNFDHKQTYVALVMSVFSLFEHILYIASYVLYFVNNYDLSTVVYVVALLFIALKHLLIFFILILFNNLFRNEVKHFFRLSSVL